MDSRPTTDKEPQMSDIAERALGASNEADIQATRLEGLLGKLTGFPQSEATPDMPETVTAPVIIYILHSLDDTVSSLHDVARFIDELERALG